MKWILMANILSHAYKGSLLSSLVTIRYTEPLDTIYQMVESDLPIYVLGGTSQVWLAKTDPRNSMKMLMDRKVVIPWDGKMEEKYLQMYKMILL